MRIPALVLSMLFPFIVYFMSRGVLASLEGRISPVLALIGSAALTGMSLLSWGDYVEILVLWTLVFLLPHEIAFRTAANDRVRRSWLNALLGLVAGVGWWTHPAIVLPLSVAGVFLLLDDKCVFFQAHFWIGLACFLTGSLSAGAIPGRCLRAP